MTHFDFLGNSFEDLKNLKEKPAPPAMHSKAGTATGKGGADAHHS